MTVIDNKEVDFHIYPRFDKVYAEIYYKVYAEIYYESYTSEIQMLSKEFGGYFRKPKESDYIKARKWCENQIKWMETANK